MSIAAPAVEEFARIPVFAWSSVAVQEIPGPWFPRETPGSSRGTWCRRAERSSGGE
ncbi:MAG: hypothetical protein MZV64_29720 [Ignavibacteriales bacterium]|nr:hypothetical protein [Ignavibacteriales bacterium]